MVFDKQYCQNMQQIQKRAQLGPFSVCLRMFEELELNVHTHVYILCVVDR